MTETDTETRVRDLAHAAGHRVHREDPWLVVLPPDTEAPDHGWKLHVSTRAATFPALVQRLLPVLLGEGCVFKLARSPAVLAELNDGITAPAAVGKAVTVYPRPDRVRELGLALVELLAGHDGPRVVSDRRIDGAAPVYYRYGPFAPDWRTDRSGHTDLVIRGPGGEVFDGEADSRGYRQPSWVSDPFPDATNPLPDAGPLLGGRYLVTEGIRESARGNVYRGVEGGTGRPVVIKQARALVAESSGEVDTRMRLRNERRVLHALDGVPGVPRFLDHFRHADDEFLVVTDEGPTNLGDDLARNGPYRPDGDGTRSLRLLAEDLARIVGDVHDRGVVMRDVKPGNIIVRATGTPRVSLVDFGIAALDGLHLPGGSPGYAPDRQTTGEPPRPADDLYALGMTLIEAATGLRPVSRVDAHQARTKALETIRSRWGAPDGVLGTVVDLVHDDVAVAGVAARRLRTGAPDHVTGSRLPRPPVVDAGSTTALAEVLLDQLIDKVDAALAVPGGRRRPNSTLYGGLAGIGLELLHHGPATHDRVGRLLAQVTTDAGTVELGPGLLAGRTGVDIFVREARERLGLPAAARDRPDPPPAPDEFDLVSGTAGIGLGHVWFLRRDGDPRDREVVRRCAETLAAAAPTKPGLAHGTAGVVLFGLLAEDHADVDPGPADDRLTALVDAAGPLIARAAAGTGDTLRTASWCNGLAGVARVLAEAGRRRDRPDCTRLALAAGDALTGWIPRSAHLGQCCGVSGIGDLMLDLCAVPGGERFTGHAYAAAEQILLRSAGTHDRPEPVSFSTTDRDGVSWAVGLTGILGFVRRLRDQGGPRLLPEVGRP
ncbi:protein kinase domain-containing protein [Actinophytocola oryzae]|uniref:non-specific serine/threonine protein kinase n=1 Tax=Actinophytocola oryzae TaxID=502181 RepID=A0A4R7V5Q9_9PSEU|nr:lanthionine synthetase LanC family protein [Actinophytocola oryzae]TDV44803.1 lanthionine synthetase-like protein [Actinophytocola oryzae]